MEGVLKETIMNTWTLDKYGHHAFVAADNVELAIELLLQQGICGNTPEDLVPVPTHHRYVRVFKDGENLSPKEWEFIKEYFIRVQHDTYDFDYHKPNNMFKDEWDDFTNRLFS